MKVLNTILYVLIGVWIGLEIIVIQYEITESKRPVVSVTKFNKDLLEIKENNNRYFDSIKVLLEKGDK